MAIDTPFFDTIGEWEAVSGPLADDHFVNIYSAVESGVNYRLWHKSPVWIKPPSYGTSPASPEECFWLTTGTITTKNREGGIKICGNGGFGAVIDTGTNPVTLNINYIGPSTCITRNDTAASGVELNRPFFDLRGGGDQVTGLYLRGCFDTNDPFPKVCIEQRKGDGVGTGCATFHDLTIQNFGTGIHIGADDTSNTDRNTFDLIDFRNVDTCIYLEHGNVLGIWIDRLYASTSRIIVDCENGGMVRFQDQLVTKDEQIALNVQASNQNGGTFSFYELKFDNQATDSMAVNMTGVSSFNGYNTFNFFGGRDSRIIQNGDHAEILGKFVGNCSVNLYGLAGVGDIYVSGGRITAGGTVNSLSAPIITMYGCMFTRSATAKDPSVLIKKFDGTPAVKGEDYTELYVKGCYKMRTVGSPANNIPLTELSIDLPYKIGTPAIHRGY